MEVQASLPGSNPLALEQMSDEAFWEYARQRAPIQPEVSLRAEYLECKLHDTLCLIALRDLAEVLQSPHRLARLPGMPAWMAGVMAWRGETIAVVNLALYLLPDQEDDISWEADGMLLVAGQAGQALGLLVPALGFTSTIEFEQITVLTTFTGFKREDEAEIVGGSYADLPILKISALLTALVQQIGMAATYHG